MRHFLLTNLPLTLADFDHILMSAVIQMMKLHTVRAWVRACVRAYVCVSGLRRFVSQASRHGPDL